jgi:hypothetical protein
VDHVLEIDALGRRGAHREDLVGADAEMPIGQETVLRCAEAERGAGFVQHDEVVAGTLHLGEADSHRGIICCPFAPWIPRPAG